MDVLFQALRISIPYVLAAMAGILSERSGVVNIALEGMLLVGAFGAVVGTLVSGSPLIGLLCGVCAGVLLAGLHALATGFFRADHIISGLALNILAAGLTRLLLQRWYHSASNSPRVEGLEPLLGGHSATAFLTHPMVYVTLGMIIAVRWLFRTSVLGLRIRAVGENPRAARAAGLPARKLRSLGVLLSGIPAGLGGVWLAFDQHQFTDGMSGGRGYIALAAMISGRWNPSLAVPACFLFGAAEALQIFVQSGPGIIPVQLVQLLPYVLTIVTLCGFFGHARAPAALGRPLD